MTLSEGDTQKIQIYSDLHWSQRSIANEVGLSLYQIRQEQKRLGVQPSRKWSELDSETETAIVERLKAGQSGVRIADALRVPVASVYAVRDANGLGRRAAPRLTAERIRLLRRHYRAWEKAQAEELGVSVRWISRQIRRRVS